MSDLHVKPTRMELSRLKKRLVTSRRGHKLLKDKRDDLMKRFLKLIRENMELRKEVEHRIEAVYEGFILAGAYMDDAVLQEALMLPQKKINAEVQSRNVMSVNVPDFRFTDENDLSFNNYPYGFAFTSGELDASVDALYDVLPLMLRLAQIEKMIQLMADEIEKTRRRVNALEFVQIPMLQNSIKRITMKLEENERGNLTRLMKVKDTMLTKHRS